VVADRLIQIMVATPESADGLGQWATARDVSPRGDGIGLARVGL
jgi:hypothetical protein